MKAVTSSRALASMILVGLCAIGCEKSDPSEKVLPAPVSGRPPSSTALPTAEQKPAASQPREEKAVENPSKPQAPPPEPTIPPDRSATLPGTPLKLTGVNLMVPDGWVAEAVTPGPMAPVAIFRLPKVAGDEADGMIRITYFPNMKGKDDMNIERWLSQVTQPNGLPYTKTGAQIDTRTIGNVRLTVLSLTGIVKATMSADPKPNSRMIATILDHPQGPHFVVATGGIPTLTRWEGSISGFLRSAATN